MNGELERLAADVGLLDPDNHALRWAFCYACAKRVRHLLEDPQVIACLNTLGRYVDGQADLHALAEAQQAADRLANSHRGSKSIDGCGHAAVSASYAVANAVNGRALQAASYAAYATVYADGGYGAVAEREAFEPEFQWQRELLKSLVADTKSVA